jgi:hypothetical protein
MEQDGNSKMSITFLPFDNSLRQALSGNVYGADIHCVTGINKACIYT